jgi:hypothetical protein
MLRLGQINASALLLMRAKELPRKMARAGMLTVQFFY